MGAVFALERLFDLVAPAITSSYSGNVTCEWGHTRVPVNLNVGKIGRVLFVPFGPDGDVGEIEDGDQYEQPDEAPVLQRLNHVFSVYCYAHDPTQERQEARAHDHAFMLLLLETVRQIHRAVHTWTASKVVYGKPKMLKPDSINQLGRECLLLCTIEQPILDLFDNELTKFIVYPSATLTDSLGDYSATSTTEPDGT